MTGKRTEGQHAPQAVVAGQGPAAWPLWMLRHGVPAQTGAMLGWTDSPLSALGERQARAQSERLSAQGITQILSSDLARCQATARITAERLSGQSQPALTVALSADLRELNFGAWDGQPAASIAPDALRDFYADPDRCPPPQGERWSDLTARVSRALETLSPRPTLIVAHGGSMRAALSVLLGWDMRQCWTIDLPYAALLRFQVWDIRPRTAQLTGLFQLEDRL